MKTRKLLIALSLVVTIMVAFASVSFAASIYGSPAEIIAGLTGKTVDEVNAAREDGETYGEQAVAADVLDQFHAERIIVMEDRLNALVEDGRLTQADADARLATMTAAIADCDGTGTGVGLSGGVGFKGELGARDGTGYTEDGARGNGGRRGVGMQDGTGAGTGVGGGMMQGNLDCTADLT
ncbi:MAG: hypothetical protein PHC86_06395 [Eubacteriales bacterium]|nr:hypothetical protein [Eubacteriales bacterium]